jgi:trans-aconitate 2-methyltransferase
VNDWSSSLYLKFEDERSRPARDLLAQVPLISARRVFDLGCGPGNSTELLVARFPGAEIVGVDTSPDMLAAARKRLPAQTFVAGDVASWMPDAPADLIFSNALFQWVPDHIAVLARVMGALKSGGVLAIQVPDSLDESSHVLMRDMAQSGPWAARFRNPIEREAIGAPRDYYDALKPLSARLDIWHTLYNHPMADAPAIVEWLKGTGLRPYLDRLDASEQGAWLAEYEARVAKAYPPLVDGRVLFRFPRLFMVAVRL